MKKIYYTGQPLQMEPQVATIGFFDGVHLGHQYLIRQVVDKAHAIGLQSMVITFDKQPRQVLQPDYHPQLLTTLEEKLLLLSKTGVDHVVILSFDKELAALSAHDFMKDVLFNGLNVRQLIIGYDNRFGKNRAEGFDDYVRYGREWGMEVLQSDGYAHVHSLTEESQATNVSSTLVRSYIEQGALEAANSCLGYPYMLEGRVVKGVQKGRKLGFPTANLDTSASQQLIPASGVYAVKVRLEHAVTEYHGMMNIGRRPTFDGAQQTLEVHIMNISENLYGQQLHVSFLHRIRGERKFESPEALAAQLAKDKAQIEELFEKEIA